MPRREEKIKFHISGHILCTKDSAALHNGVIASIEGFGIDEFKTAMALMAEHRQDSAALHCEGDKDAAPLKIELVPCSASAPQPMPETAVYYGQSQVSDERDCGHLGFNCTPGKPLNANVANSCDAPSQSTGSAWVTHQIGLDGGVNFAGIMTTASGARFEDLRIRHDTSDLGERAFNLVANLTAEQLTHSEVYRQQMAAISTCALGYAPPMDSIRTDLLTPAYRDVFDLRAQTLVHQNQLDAQLQPVVAQVQKTNSILQNYEVAAMRAGWDCNTSGSIEDWIMDAIRMKGEMTPNPREQVEAFYEKQESDAQARYILERVRMLESREQMFAQEIERARNDLTMAEKFIGEFQEVMKRQGWKSTLGGMIEVLDKWLTDCTVNKPAIDELKAKVEKANSRTFKALSFITKLKDKIRLRDPFDPLLNENPLGESQQPVARASAKGTRNQLIDG